MVFLRIRIETLAGRLIFLLDIGLDFVFLLDIDFFINQLLTQNYIAETACTIADSPFFCVMVFTTLIVNNRIYVQEKNESWM